VDVVYGHHTAHSGYARLADYVGQRIELSPAILRTRDGLLRPPCKLASLYSGVYEYSRHDCAGELNALMHMLRHRDAIYHFLYGEKSLRFLARMNGKRGHRIVATFHHPPEMYGLHFQSTRHLRGLAHAIVVSSSQLEFMEKKVGRGKVSLAPHGVDTDYWKPNVRSVDGPRRLVFAGVHMRDVATLRRVVQRVLEKCHDVEFVLISSNDECASIAARKGVRWLKSVPDDVYGDELSAAELLVLPLLHSTAVNTVLEALACGVPVVTTRGGISDYLNPSCAIECNPHDSEGVAQQVIELLADRDRLCAMRAEARQQALRFRWSRVAQAATEVYRRVGCI
jgi:glycosyltransferase involved in cell wall biosynthesis